MSRILLLLSVFLVFGCSQFNATEVEWRDRKNGGGSTGGEGPPPYEGAQFEPAGPVTAYNTDRNCSTVFPELNQPSNLQTCSDICGDIFPSSSGTSGPSLRGYTCHAPGTLNKRTDGGWDVQLPLTMEIHVDEPIWGVAGELMDPNKYWPSRLRTLPYRKAGCPTELPGGVVRCRFLTNLRIWRIFTCETPREEVVLSIEDANLIERENDANCSVAPAVSANGISDTLPPITWYPSNYYSPIYNDAVDEADVTAIHNDLRGDFFKAEPGGDIVLAHGVFGRSSATTINVVSTGLGIEIIAFANMTRVSFDNTDPNAREAVLSLTDIRYRTNPNNATLDGAQIRWFEGDRVEIDLTITQGGSTNTYTNIVKNL